jgi:hypothetical protein
MPDESKRTVMVRDWYSVPAVPDATLKEVFGKLTPDPRIELIVLTFEYWLNGGAPNSMLREQMLAILPGNINQGNAYRLVQLLAKRGVADEFFDLTLPAIDRDGAFRALLLSNGILLDTIRYYASWNGINPREFLNGFVFGVAESFASIVFDLASLVKLIARAQEAELQTMLLLTIDPKTALNNIWDQVIVIGQVAKAIIEQLDPTKIPAAVVKTWRDWNAQFERHLENLDPFSAGRLLGNTGGNLWQILTGIVALVKLLRIGGRLTLRYGSLFLGKARRIAVEAAVVMADLADVLRVLGRRAIDELPQMGLATLRTLFPPRLLRQLVQEGRALLTYGDLTLLPVFDEGYAVAFPGARMRAPFAVMVAENGKPMAMAVMSERLPSAAGGGLRAQAMASVDETLDRLDDLFRELTKPPTKSALRPKVAAAAALRMLEERLSTQLRKILTKVAYDAFNDLRKTGRFNARELGQLIHKRMAAQIGADVAKASPGLSVHTEKELRTIYRTLADDTELAETLARNGDKVLDETIPSFVARRTDLMDLIGLPDNPAARNPAAVAKALREQFGWKAGTTVGELRSDLVLVDGDARRLINVDWTPSTSADVFEETWSEIAKDLGAGFSGDPDAVADAYRQAFKGQFPEDVKAKLKRLTTHAVRETVIRKIALEEILGPLWPVSSYEMLYNGLAKLWRPN